MQTSFYNGYKVNLIESLEDLEIMKSRFSKDVNVGLDTETEGLDYNHHSVVGYCVSGGKSYTKADYQGYYIPIRHTIEAYNLPIDKVVEVVQWVVDNFKLCLFNRGFDYTMAEKDGVDFSKAKSHDVQIMCHLVMGDPFPSLKDETKKYLKFDVIDFASNNAKDHNFGSTDPSISYVYACFDTQTKFLTRSGFKFYDEIDDESEIGQFNPESNQIEFVLPIRRHDYVADSLIEFGSSRVSCRVTPNHRVYGRSNIRRPVTIKLAEQWQGKALSLQTGTEGYEGEYVNDFIFKSNDKRHPGTYHNFSVSALNLAKLEGMILGDGNVCPNNGSYTVRWSQRDCIKKQESINWCRTLNEDLGGIFFEGRNSKNDIYWSKTHKEFGSLLREHLYQGNNQKKVPEWIYNAPLHVRKAFLEGLRYADGHKSADRESWHIDVCTNKKLAEQVLDICVSVGYTCKMSFYRYPNSTFNPEPYDYWRICVTPNVEFTTVNKQSWIQYKGKFRVVCFTVPSGLLVVQRNYTNYISGNSQDPLVTTLLGRKIWAEYPYIRKIYPLDNKVGEVVRKLGLETDLYINKDIISRELERVSTEMASVQQEIYAITGYPFRLTSTREKADALTRFVTLTTKTSKGQFKVDSETLEKIDHPLAKLLIRYAELEKFRGSYLAKMMDFPNPFKVSYSTVNVSCLTDKNVVRTKDGIKSISDVLEGEEILTRFGFRKVVWTNKFKDQVLRIQFKNGTFIEGNAKHPVLCGEEWKGLGELNVGDRVKICDNSVLVEGNVTVLPEFESGLRKQFTFDTHVDKELASVLGFLDGDGSLVTDGVKLCFSKFEPEVEEYFVNLFAKRFNMSIPTRNVGADNTIQFKFCSAALSRYLSGIGVKPHGDEKGVDISHWNSNEQFAYVAALFDTDGSINKSGSNFNVRLEMTSKGVIDNVLQILRFHGIDCHEFVVTSNRKQPLYSLRVRGRKAVYKFVELIAPHMVCVHKLIRLQEYVSLVKSPWDKFQDETQVIGIEVLGEDVVYDIEVEDCHEFIANGVVTHNTGRLSSGSQKGNSYFVPFNIQNVPKVEVKRYIHRDEILGYVINDDPEGALGKMKAKGGLRDAFVTESDEWVWVSGDYSGEELRIAANFSGEVNFIEPILEGKDLHMHVAKKMFGFEDPDHRTSVKTLNFGVLYGATEYTVARKLGKTIQEAKDLLTKYFDTMKQLYRWQQEQIKEGRRKGFIYTYFGRPRAVFQYYNQPGKQGYADRTCLNSPVQGCVPIEGYVSTDNSIISFSEALGRRILQRGNRLVVPTHRGSNEPIIVVFNTGDFLVCDVNHKLVTGSLENPKIANVRDGLQFRGKRQDINLTPLRRRRVGLGNLTSSTSKCLSFIKLTLKRGQFIERSNDEVASALFRLALSHKWFSLEYLQIVRVRELCDLFGYNVIYSQKKDMFSVRFHRAKTCRVKSAFHLLPEGDTVQVGSCTALSGLQIYENQGFWTKNTGGDLLRLKLCQMQRDFDNDPELRENVRFICQVHDEINLQVRVGYLQKAFYWLRDLMYFKPDNFKVPLVAELSVGRDWGHQVTCEDISDDNKIILPEYEEA